MGISIFMGTILSRYTFKNVFYSLSPIIVSRISLLLVKEKGDKLHNLYALTPQKRKMSEEATANRETDLEIVDQLTSSASRRLLEFPPESRHTRLRKAKTTEQESIETINGNQSSEIRCT